MAQDKLIIVESPTKCKTIGKILGKGYNVTSTLGHIRDLPKHTMGVDVTSNFNPKYEIPKDKQKFVKSLVALIKKAKEIYIATDEDREGEAIGWHVIEAAKLKSGNFKRITFHEITPSAIKHAVENPRTINYNLVNAQQARRILDRLVGYSLSPLLGKKIYKGLSAGRVQSSALRIIVEREREIQNFVKQEFWSIEAKCLDEKDSIEFVIKFVSKAGKKYKKLDIKIQDEALKLIDGLEKTDFFVDKIEKKERKRHPSPPFVTSTLQQLASRVLGFSSKKTMFVAQSLYEGITIQDEQTGLITYMRTDSPSIAEPARLEASKYIKNEIGQKYLPSKKRIYKAKAKGAQEAHECIRPVSVYRSPQDVEKYLTKDQFRLYELIWKRFIASQMKEALFNQEVVTVNAKDTVWQTIGEVMLFDGFLKLYNYDSDSKDVILPQMKKGDQVNVLDIVPNQHFTEPPPRYTEASLIKILEANGIGRPSTYAPTIGTLLQRGYVKIEKKKFIPEEIGVTVTEVLEKYFPYIVDTHFTASMENSLDKVAIGEEEWVGMLDIFYKPFLKTIEKAEKSIKVKEQKLVGRKCPKCDSDLIYKKSRYGEFIGCSGFPKCRYIESEDAKQKKEDGRDLNLEPCPKCGGELAVKKSKYGEFIACTNYPKCRYSRSLEEEKVDKNCPDCGKPLVVKFSKRGKFLGCSGYPECKHLESLPKKK
ncbi:type I DNA topoisomerase [bacterium]